MWLQIWWLLLLCPFENNWKMLHEPQMIIIIKRSIEMTLNFRQIGLNLWRLAFNNLIRLLFVPSIGGFQISNLVLGKKNYPETLILPFCYSHYYFLRKNEKRDINVSFVWFIIRYILSPTSNQMVIYIIKSIGINIAFIYLFLFFKP